MVKFVVNNSFESIAEAFARIPWNGARFTLDPVRAHATFILAAYLFLPLLTLHAQPATTSIQVADLRMDHEHATLTLRWNGGFPPYHVRFTSDLNAGWTEHPRPVATNELTLPIPGPGAGPLFFQVRTEFEPLELTAIKFAPDANFLLLQWKGGTPPFQVQNFDLTTQTWNTRPELFRQRHFEDFSFGDQQLFRIVSVPDTTPPPPPSELLLYGARCDRVVIGWNESDDGPAGSGVSGYILYRNEQQIRQFPPGTTQFLDDNLLPGATNHYQIATIDLMGNEGTPTRPLAVITPDCSVTDTNLQYEDCRLTLTWDANEERDIAGYVVHWGTQPGQYPWQIDAMQTNTITIPGLTPGTAYFVSVTAYTVDGTESDPAAELIFIPPSPMETAYAAKPIPPPPPQ